jgi:GWxTD domain-containing protein
VLKLRLAALLFLVTVCASAAGLSKTYKAWDKSPDAYFLTSDERAQWKNIHTNAEAEKFVGDYFARRGPEFPAMLKDRIVIADKYFSAGKVKGSETLRGKVIIVFGPPSGIDKSAGRGSMGKGTTGEDARYSGGDASISNPLSNVGAGASGLMHSEKTERFIFEYDQQRSPAAIGKPFRVDIAIKSAADQEAADPKDLEEKFDAVAKASIVK